MGAGEHGSVGERAEGREGGRAEGRKGGRAEGRKGERERPSISDILSQRVYPSRCEVAPLFRLF